MSAKVRWCLVIKISGKSIFAHTEDDERVFISRQYEGMDVVEEGDILEITPRPFEIKPGSVWKMPPKLYGGDPRIIARRFLQKPETRQQVTADDNPVEWKQAQDRAADAQQFREVSSGAGCTVAATS